MTPMFDPTVRPADRPLIRRVIPEVSLHESIKGYRADFVFHNGDEFSYKPDLVNNALAAGYRCGCGNCNVCLIVKAYETLVNEK